MSWKKEGLLLWSWAFYDFANTIFSAVVLTAFFPLYFTRLAGSNWALGVATTGSMILAGLFVPFLGTLSDQTGKTKKYLVLSTLYCIAALVLLSVFHQPAPLIICFTISCFFYHASLVFYNSLLPVVASPEKQGFASGLGTGLGYLGVVVALPIASLVSKKLGEGTVFATAGVLFFICSLPLFLCVPERQVENPISFRLSLWKSEWQKILLLLGEVQKDPVLLGFFAGNFFAVDALNTMIFWFSVYAREMFHPTQDGLIFLLMGINLSAFVMGILAGILTDRFGAMKTFLLAAGALIVSILVLTLAPNFNFFVAVGLTGGAFSIAGIWTAGRKVLVELAPEKKVGEFFGLYGLTTKISVIGNMVFSIVADQMGFKPALRILLFPSAAGFLFLAFSAFHRSREATR